MRFRDLAVQEVAKVSKAVFGFTQTLSNNQFRVMDDDYEIGVDANVKTYGLPIDEETLLRTYQAVEAVYASITNISREGANVPLKVWKKNKTNIREECIDHPVNELLDKPNGLLNRFELIERAIAFPLLAGDGYIWKDKVLGTTNTPVRKLVYLRPDLVAVASKSGGDDRVFKRADGSNSIVFQDEDIIHFKRFNPFTPFKGLPPTVPSNGSMLLELYLTEYAKDFFKNAVVPSMMFGTDEKNVSDVTIERFKHEIAKRFQGNSKHHNPMVLYSGLKPLKHERALPTDSSYTDINEMVRQSVYKNMGAFDLLAIDKGLSGEGLSQATKYFWYKTMFPIFRTVEQTFTNSLLNEYSGADGGCFFEFDRFNIPALRDDITEESLGFFRLIMAETLSKEEVRVRLGYPRQMPKGDSTGISNPQNGQNRTPASSRVVSNEERPVVEEAVKQVLYDAIQDIMTV